MEPDPSLLPRLVQQRTRDKLKPDSLAHREVSAVLDPSGDYYYWWLNTMVFPVMYNLIIVVCRFGAMGLAETRIKSGAQEEWANPAWGCCGGGRQCKGPRFSAQPPGDNTSHTEESLKPTLLSRHAEPVSSDLQHRLSGGLVSDGLHK